MYIDTKSHSEPDIASNSGLLSVSKSDNPVDFDTLLLPLSLQDNRLSLTGKTYYYKIIEKIQNSFLEKRIKGWSRKKKEALINEDYGELVRLSNLKNNSKE